MSILHNRTLDDRANISAATVRGSSAPVMKLDFERAASFLAFEAEHPEVKGMDRAARMAYADAKQKELNKTLFKHRQELKQQEQEHAFLQQQLKNMDGLIEWIDSETKIEKPSAPHFRDLRRAVAAGEAVCMDRDVSAKLPALDYEKEVFRFAHVMVVEHDWASAFANSNMDDAGIRLPYDLCAFEFQYSGVPAIVFATQFGSEIALCWMPKWRGKWFVPTFCSPMDGESMMSTEVAKQIRAICIAMDAGIAYSETRREEHSGTGKRNFLAPRDYNVVSLTSRTRARPPLAPNQTGRHVRLHFRRGHYRHFEDHKTWINWMLVGDPDLGFVDKHYRL